MSKRPWGKRKKNLGVKNGLVAAAPVPTTPARRIEFKTVIQNLAFPLHLDDEELAGWVNAGWQVAHETVNTYYHPSTDSTCHSRIVRLSRMVDVVPSPSIKQEVEVHPTPSPSPVDGEGNIVPPFTVVIETLPELVPVPTV
jgi:hypothetical protein